MSPTKENASIPRWRRTIRNEQAVESCLLCHGTARALGVAAPSGGRTVLPPMSTLPLTSSSIIATFDYRQRLLISWFPRLEMEPAFNNWLSFHVWKIERERYTERYIYREKKTPLDTIVFLSVHSSVYWNVINIIKRPLHSTHTHVDRFPHTVTY